MPNWVLDSEPTSLIMFLHARGIYNIEIALSNRKRLEKAAKIFILRLHRSDITITFMTFGQEMFITNDKLIGLGNQLISFS